MPVGTLATTSPLTYHLMLALITPALSVAYRVLQHDAERKSDLTD